MNTIAAAEMELPLHEHLKALPVTTLKLGKRIFRNLCSVGFFVLFAFSIVAVAVLMLAKGMTGRKKADLVLNDPQQTASKDS